MVHKEPQLGRNQYIKYIAERSDEGSDRLFRKLVEEYNALETEVNGPIRQ